MEILYSIYDRIRAQSNQCVHSDARAQAYSSIPDDKNYELFDHLQDAIILGYRNQVHMPESLTRGK